MRDLFFRLNTQNIQVDIYSFSKVSKQRSLKLFIEIYEKLLRQVNTKKRRVTNLPLVRESDLEGLSNQDIADIYRYRWQI